MDEFATEAFERTITAAERALTSAAKDVEVAVNDAAARPETARWDNVAMYVAKAAAQQATLAGLRTGRDIAESTTS